MNLIKTGLLSVVLGSAFHIMAVHAEPIFNLNFHGALVAEACTISPGDESLKLDFGPMLSKDIYKNKRTDSRPFHIKLAGCNSSIASMVKISFNGIENLKTPGLLALDPSSQATGIAIGFETESGQFLKLNTLTPNTPLGDGNVLLPFYAYLEGEPEAIANKTVQSGFFSATVLFSVFYE